MLTPVLLIVVIAAAIGAGVVVWQWVGSPVSTGLRLADGDGGSGDSVFTVPAGGAGSSQVLNAVASVGDTIVAAGSDTTSPVPRPLFLMSRDGGKSWQLGSVSGQGGYEAGPSTVGSVAGGDGRWLAVGDASQGYPVAGQDAGTSGRGMWTSTDGFGWSAVEPAGLTAFRGGDRIADIARTKAGFVAVGATVLDDGTAGPIVWLSPDGRTWDRVPGADVGSSQEVRGIKAVVAKGDDVVALADAPSGGATSVVLRSADGGRTWKRAEAALSGVTPRPGALAVAPGGFVVVPTRQRTDAGDVRVHCSSDGAKWDACGSIKGLPRDSTGVTGIASSAAGVAAVARVGWERYAVYNSKDGKSWAKGTDLGEVPGTLRALSVSESGTLVVGGDKRAAADVDNQLVLMTAAKGSAAVPVALGDIEGLTRVARATNGLGAANGTFVTVGAAAGDAAIWTSRDGQTWSGAGPVEILGGAHRQSLGDVAYGRKGWIAVGDTMRDASSTEPLVVTSGEGTSWRRVPVNGPLALADGHYYLAPHAVAASKVESGKGAGYVLVGEDRGPGGVTPVMWFTSDLRRYARSAKLPAGGAGVRIHDVTATSEGFVAVGGAGAARHESGVVWVSEDGLNWTARKRVTPPDSSSAGLRHVVAVGDRIVAVGDARTDGGRRAFAAVSTDNGGSWEYGWLPADQAAAVQDLAASPEDDDGGGIVAVGWHGASAESDSAAWTSSDGLEWQRQSLTQEGLGGAGAQWLRAVAVMKGDVVAVGRSTTYSADHLTLWRTGFHR
ncbi:exo-alpha-sialidase [Spongiactinospora sp. TRM90649]|uniref:exo-alpha-sialidase n=1 Tax=Spongiactinospora sp. TRM90649 TaxID=3031114 RepID=UPI0023F8C8A7|nr:exo-alpha-sialidase [Spongiactinospora sp. TRM90649]MDF5755480.1 exo-alpha-sialidase [Spongiactinospora sp. TRM90649]